MGKLKKWFKKVADSPVGTVLSVVVYTAMAILVLSFFEGHGVFIYEGF